MGRDHLGLRKIIKKETEYKDKKRISNTNVILIFLAF